MSAARARRRLMAHERYRRRALDLGAAVTMARHTYSNAHAMWFWRAQAVGRWAPIGIRRPPWLVPEPKRRTPP